MAKFTQDPNATNDPLYTGASQGTDRAMFQDLPRPLSGLERPYEVRHEADTSAATALKGLGDLLGTGAKAVDDILQIAIEKDLRTGVDKIRDEHGVGAAAAAVEDGPFHLEQTEPPAIRKLGNRIQGLYNSFLQGGMGNSDYWAKAEALVRQTKAAYPGYEGVIDQKISSITGSIPANALRSSLLADMTELQRKMQEGGDKYQAFVRSHLGVITLTLPDFHDRANGRSDKPPYTPAEVYQAVGQHEAIQKGNEAIKLDIAVRKARGEDVAERAEEYAYTRVGQMVATLFSTTAQGADFMKLAQEIRTSPKPDAEKVQELRGLVREAKMTLSQRLDHMLFVEPVDDKGTTLARLIKSKDKINAIKEVVLGQVNTFYDAIENEKYGIASFWGNYGKQVMDQGMSKILATGPEAALLSGFQKLLGNEAFNWMVVNNPGLVKDISGLMTSVGLAKMGTGQSNFKDVIDEVKKSKGSLPTLRKAITGLLTNPDAPMEAKINIARGIFTPGTKGDWSEVLRKVDSSQGQLNLYMALASPEITQVMQQMKAKDATLWNNYVEWNKHNFAVIFKQQGDQIAQVMKSNPHYQNLHLTSAGQIVVTNSSGYTVRSDTVDNMNKALLVLQPVLKANGETLQDQLVPILQTMGMRPDTGEAPKDKAGEIPILGILSAGVKAQMKSLLGAAETIGRVVAPTIEELNKEAEKKKKEAEKARNADK